MPRFTYVALDSRGQESTGMVEAASTDEAIGQLRQAGFFPTNVSEEGKAGRVDGKGCEACGQPPAVLNRAEKIKASFSFSAKELNQRL